MWEPRFTSVRGNEPSPSLSNHPKQNYWNRKVFHSRNRAIKTSLGMNLTLTGLLVILGFLCCFDQGGRGGDSSEVKKQHVCTCNGNHPYKLDVCTSNGNHPYKRLSKTVSFCSFWVWLCYTHIVNNSFNLSKERLHKLETPSNSQY